MTGSRAVAIVGVGGIGCPAALALAAAGVPALLLVDGDRVDRSNLHRQILYGEADIGRLKVEAARDRLLVRNPSLEIGIVAAHATGATLAALAARAAVVVDGTDDARTKLALSDACACAGTPLVHAGVVGLAGHVLAVLPRRTPCVRCLWDRLDGGNDNANGDGDGDVVGNDGVPPTCARDGVLGPVAGLIGALAGETALRLLDPVISGDLLARPLLRYDARSGVLRRVAIRRRRDCRACGPAPAQAETSP